MFPNFPSPYYPIPFLRISLPLSQGHWLSIGLTIVLLRCIGGKESVFSWTSEILNLHFMECHWIREWIVEVDGWRRVCRSLPDVLHVLRVAKRKRINAWICWFYVSANPHSKQNNKKRRRWMVFERDKTTRLIWLACPMFFLPFFLGIDDRFGDVWMVWYY